MITQKRLHKIVSKRKNIVIEVILCQTKTSLIQVKIRSQKNPQATINGQILPHKSFHRQTDVTAPAEKTDNKPIEIEKRLSRFWLERFCFVSKLSVKAP